MEMERLLVISLAVSWSAAWTLWQLKQTRTADVMVVLGCLFTGAFIVKQVLS